jgi:hypothetical protein
MPTLRELLLTAPDSQLDASMVELVKSWSDPPTAIQVLEVVDLCVFGSLASGVLVTLLQYELEDAFKREGTTLKEVLKLAVWRPEKDRV